VLSLILRSVGQLVRGLFTGAHRPSPLFDEAGAPVVEPRPA